MKQTKCFFFYENIISTIVYISLCRKPLYNARVEICPKALNKTDINAYKLMNAPCHRLNKVWEDVKGSSLFVHTECSDNVIQQLIGHAQDIACWVAAEIVSCNSIKVNKDLIWHK